MTNRITFLTLLVCAAMAAASEQPAASPAQLAIEKAKQQIAKDPRHAPSYNALAMAYARRARETSDVAYYEKSEETLRQSLQIAPGNFEALKTRTWLALGRHEFARAREMALELNRRVPDDITVYGYLADANAELGNYADAVEAAQWMLNLRPGNVAGLTRAAYLRELHGDLSGALELMQMAYDATPLQEREDRAWLLVQTAHLHLLAGDLANAETSAWGALSLFPGYHYALGVLAQIRIAKSDYAEAVTLLEQRYRSAPHAENLYALANALELAGRHADAARAYGEFERKSVAESGLADNSNHELIAYYLGPGHNPRQALEIARREIDRRHDVYTLDCYARALAANGLADEARRQMDRAVAFGIKDPEVLRHARQIAGSGE